MMNGVYRDLYFAVRLLVKNAGFTVVAVLSLALGIGANTAIFSIVSAVFFQPIPVVEPDRVVAIYTLDSRNPGHLPLSVYNGRDIRERSQTLRDVATHTFMGAELTNGDAKEVAPAMVVTGNYFRTLGIEAELGRMFDHDDDHARGSHPEVVLSYSLWQQLGADPDLVGEQLTVNGQPLTVVGVAPESFRGTQLFEPRLWVPWSMLTLLQPEQPWVESRRWLATFQVGRLAEGATVAQADDELHTIGDRLAAEYPDDNSTRTFTAIPLAHALLGPDQRDALVTASTVLFSVVALILLIGCANVANLLIARASVRRGEIAVRRVVGATTSRLLRQLFTESVVLAGVAGMVGLLLAVPMLEGAWALRPPGLSLAGVQPTIDVGVLTFTAAISLTVGLLFGLAPAVRAASSDLTTPLKEETTPSTASGSRFGLRPILVIVQVALSLVALAGAGLFIRSLENVLEVDPGFEVDSIVIAGLNIGRVQGSDESRRAAARAVLEAVTALPEVDRAALANGTPMGGGLLQRTTFVDGRDIADAGEGILTNTLLVDPAYLDTMGITLVDGRSFGPEDVAGGARVVVVNRAFARRYWRDEQPVGQQIRFFGEPGTIEIVGLVEDTRFLQLTQEPQPMMYLPLSQWPSPFLALHVRTSGDVEMLIPTLASAMTRSGTGLELQNIEPLRTLVEESAWAPKIAALLLGVFGAVGLLLAAVGIYGVTSYDVRQRTREIGIRMALGARPGDILRHVLARGMLMVVLGIVIGLACAVVLRQVIGELLFGVGAVDPVAFGGAAALLVAVALVAAGLPAYRAVRIQPVSALRME